MPPTFAAPPGDLHSCVKK